MNEPETRYALHDGARIAFQVLGEDGPDVIATSGSFGSMDAEWDSPEVSLFNREVAEFCRFIRFDGLGSGASDPVPLAALPPMESSAAEILAVLDAVPSEQAILIANAGSVPAALLAAATWPDRFSGLILMHAMARMRIDVDYPDGVPQDALDMMDEMFASWDVDQVVASTFPNRAGDPQFDRWARRYLRSIASPAAFRAFVTRLIDTDVRSVLPLIRTPTLVVHREGYEEIPMAAGRYVAAHIEGAEFCVIPGSEGTPWFDHPEAVIGVMSGFMDGVSPARASARTKRVMATVLFTDIVGSTDRASELGDATWHRMLELHSDIASRAVSAHQGRLVKTTGDGILATFDGPGRALLCASEMGQTLRGVGLPIRAGVHSGEVEVVGDDVGGIAVHIAARIMATAGADEVLVSQTVRDLVVGSAFRFEDRGMQRLRGVEGEWQVLALV